ncbi:MAG: hypothetical protein GW778_06815 [Alphaproteobacteria bacterium]|nr:hypothetical protein [Alphaproteobacteria bacterium]
MKIKGLLMMGAALVVCGATHSAQAAERLSLSEVNNFVAKLTNAVNSPDPNVARSFLHRTVSASATYSNTLNTPSMDPRYAYQVNNGYGLSPYYRYPYAYNTYLKPTSYSAVGKAGLINQIDHKKAMIPHYHQTMDILGTRMPADASSALVDVSMREFGLSYAMAPYGVQHGQKVQHTNARCQLNVGKQDGQVMLKGMSCNTVPTL